MLWLPSPLKIFNKNLNRNQARDEIAKLDSTPTTREWCPVLDMKLNKSNCWNQILQTQKIFDKNFNQNQARDDEIAKLNSTCTRRKWCARLDMKLNKSNLLESKFYTLKNLW